jgi:hypothetical protein
MLLFSTQTRINYQLASFEKIHCTNIYVLVPALRNILFGKNPNRKFMD